MEDAGILGPEIHISKGICLQGWKELLIVQMSHHGRTRNQSRREVERILQMFMENKIKRFVQWQHLAYLFSKTGDYI